MNKTRDIAVIVGSLRRDSINRKVAHALAQLAPAGFKLSMPEAYIGGADKLFDASGKLINAGTQKFLQGFLGAYASWVTANTKS